MGGEKVNGSFGVWRTGDWSIACVASAFHRTSARNLGAEFIDGGGGEGGGGDDGGEGGGGDGGDEGGGGDGSDSGGDGGGGERVAAATMPARVQNLGGNLAS